MNTALTRLGILLCTLSASAAYEIPRTQTILRGSYAAIAISFTRFLLSKRLQLSLIFLEDYDVRTGNFLGRT